MTRTVKCSRFVQLSALVAVVQLLIGAAFAQQSEDGPATGTYRLAPGDRVDVAITLRPITPVDNQMIQPGDRLGVFYHFAIPDVDEAYRVEPGDELKVEFRYSPELSQLYYTQKDDKIAVLSSPYIVQPDGTLVMRGLQEPLEVAGKTLGEIDAMIEAAYEDLLEIPEAIVWVDRQDLLHETLRQIFQMMENRPVSYLTLPVPADGKLSLPLIPELEAAGRTVQDISGELTRRYREMGYYLVTTNFFFDQVTDQRHRQLVEILNEGNNPMSLPILRTGELALPLIGPVDVAGLSIEEANRALSEAYHQRRGLERVEVSLWVVDPARPRPAR